MSARDLGNDGENKSLNWRSQTTLDVAPELPPTLYVTSSWVSHVSFLTVSFFVCKMIR